MIPVPSEFAQHVHSVASQKMLSDGCVYPMLFLGEMGRGMLIVSVHELMQNDHTKDVLSLLPAYLGVLRGGLDFVSLISESWFVDNAAVAKEFGQDRAEDQLFIRGMVSKYGGVSFLPAHLREEVVTASVDVADGTYFTAWSIRRDASGKPSLAEYDSRALEKAEVSSGRLVGMLNRYHKLKNTFNELSVVLKRETGETLTLDLAAESLSKFENTDAHVLACDLAFKMMATLPVETNPPVASSPQ